jgi:hypothetical protein
MQDKRIKTEGSKIYYISVLEAGKKPQLELKGNILNLTIEDVNLLTKSLQGKSILLDHIDNVKDDKFYKEGANKVIGRVLETYSINEPFISDNPKKKIYFPNFSAAKILIDDIEALNKIDKEGWLPSIHYTYNLQRDSIALDDTQSYLEMSNVKYCLLDLSSHNVAMVENPRYNTQVIEGQNNLAPDDLELLANVIPTNSRNNTYFNCINSIPMFGTKKESKNGMDDIASKLDAALLILQQLTKSSDPAEVNENNNVNTTPEDGEPNPTIADENNTNSSEGVEEPKKNETQNEGEGEPSTPSTSHYITKEELITILQEEIAKALKGHSESQNSCDDKSSEAKNMSPQVTEELKKSLHQESSNKSVKNEVTKMESTNSAPKSAQFAHIPAVKIAMFSGANTMPATSKSFVSMFAKK